MLSFFQFDLHLSIWVYKGWFFNEENILQAEMFIGLLLRAMKSDVNLKRVAAFAKRVLQVSNKMHSCSC